MHSIKRSSKQTSLKCSLRQCRVCSFEYPTPHHLKTCLCSSLKACASCYSNQTLVCQVCNTAPTFQSSSESGEFGLKTIDPRDKGSRRGGKHQDLLRQIDQDFVLKLKNYRLVQQNLLYVIGIPQMFRDEALLKSDKFFGQFGQVKRLIINSQSEDYYEGQLKVYVWYDSPFQVALALKMLNGLKLDSSIVIKCSFGTSKYCKHFLEYSKCQVGESCPFIHYMEKARDKVIVDDREFRNYLDSQNRIASEFLALLSLSGDSLHSEATARNNLEWMPSPKNQVKELISGLTLQHLALFQQKQGLVLFLRSEEESILFKPKQPSPFKNQLTIKCSPRLDQEELALQSNPKQVSSFNPLLCQSPQRKAFASIDNTPMSMSTASQEFKPSKLKKPQEQSIPAKSSTIYKNPEEVKQISSPEEPLPLFLHNLRMMRRMPKISEEEEEEEILVEGEMDEYELKMEDLTEFMLKEAMGEEY